MPPSSHRPPHRAGFAIFLLAAIAMSATACSQTAPRRASGTPEIDVSLESLPTAKPRHWDPVLYNRLRGELGAVPEPFRMSLTDLAAAGRFVGQHLPHVVSLEDTGSDDLDGRAALMWGDPEQGYPRHPQAVPGPSNGYEGLWFDWIGVSRTSDEGADQAGEPGVDEIQSTFTAWPETRADDTGAYAAFDGVPLIDDDGRSTVYLVRLPAGVGPGDTVRVHGHCLLHGDFVDFIDL